jgi:endonuclease YncB( thermonuclease family)
MNAHFLKKVFSCDGIIKLSALLLLPALAIIGMCSVSFAVEMPHVDIVEEPAERITHITGLVVGRNYEPGDSNDWKYYSLHLIAIKNEEDADRISGNHDIRKTIYDSLSYKEIISRLELPPSSKILKVMIRSDRKYCIREGAVLDIERIEDRLWKLEGGPDPADGNEEEEDMGLPSTAEVLGVIDGGFLILKLPNFGTFVRAGLMGVEIPDSESNDCMAGFAREARDFVESLVDKQNVTLAWDSHSKVSMDGKLLPYVFVENNISVNAEAVKKGLALVPEDWKTDERCNYKNLEAEARKNKIGIWEKCLTTGKD